jgi:hypothetical protein
MYTAICDFQRSFMAFTLAGVNTARIQIDAICRVTEGDTTREYVLITPCRSEDTHGTGSRLFMVPNYEFSGFFERSDVEGAECLLRRTFVSHDPDRGAEWETNSALDRFGEVVIDLAMHDEAASLETHAEIVDAVRANHVIVARTTIDGPDGSCAELEYPMKTINVVDADRFQVDTGPLLVPCWARTASEDGKPDGAAQSGVVPDGVVRGDRAIEQLDEAYVVYNKLDKAEFALREPTPVGSTTEKAWHFSGIAVTDARNEMFAVV